MAKNVMKPGMTLPCPVCGELEATIKIDMTDLLCSCESCDDTFSADVARELVLKQLRRWEAVCELVAQAGELVARVKAAESGENDDMPSVVAM
jgi:hypothetical protein